MYCAVIGDIIDSRKITNDRGETQERFIAAIKNVNNKYGYTIASTFAITEGDSFYGLLSSPENLLNIIREIRLAIAPHQIRIGIGIGSIDTQIERNNSSLIDGRANSTAKDAVNYLSENKNKYESVYMTTLLKVDRLVYEKLDEKESKAYKTYENLINAVFCSCSVIEKRWDTIHADTIQLKIEGCTQREMAEKLGITQSSVQRRLISADYYLHEYYLSELESGIAQLWKEVLHV